MTIEQRFLQSRTAHAAVAWMAGIGVTAWVLLWVTTQPCCTLLIGTIAPMAMAVLIGLSARTPFGEVERASGNRLARLRMMQFAGLLAIAALFLLVAATGEPGITAALMMLRNLAGFTGIALLSAVLFGTSGAWIIPFAYGLMAGGAAMPDNQAGAWAWSVQQPGEIGALVVALLFFVVGLVLAVQRGAKREDGDLAALPAA